MAEIIRSEDAATIYEAYQSGQTDQQEAQRLAGQVNSYLDAVTYGRASGALSDEVREKVDGCAKELLAFLVRQKFDPEVQSETVGDWTKAFARGSQSTLSQEMRRIILRWLAGTGLICAWV